MLVTLGDRLGGDWNHDDHTVELVDDPSCIVTSCELVTGQSGKELV